LIINHFTWYIYILLMFTCISCQRSYQRKTYFDRHVIACEFLSKSKREKTIESEELEDTPSVRELYAIILELATKCNQLEGKLNAVSKWTNITKQKLNIVNWLNTNHNNDEIEDYATWFGNVKITETHLNHLFETDYVGGIVAALKEYLPIKKQNDNIDTRPLRAFTSKDNVFYLYNKSDKQWKMVDLECFNKLMYLFDNIFMGEFVKWQNTNKHRISIEDNFQDIYSRNLKNIMGGKNTREQLYSRIKKELYLYIRDEPPSILEYEITY